MLKSKFKILFAIFLIPLLISSCCFATATQEVTENSDDLDGIDISTLTQLPDQLQNMVDNADTEQKQGDIYLCNTDINLTNTVDGNAYLIGKTVTISCLVEGDVFVIADSLTFGDDAYINNSIYALANSISINGTCYDLYACANTININSKGYIFRDMKAMAEKINIEGEVNKNAYLGVSSLTFGENAATHIDGNLEYSSEKEISIPDNTVLGEVKFNQETTSTTKSHSILSYIVDLIKTLLLTFVLVLVLLWLAPSFTKRVKETQTSKLLSSFGIGILVPAIFIIASIVLILTIIGIPIFVCIMFAFILLTYFGSAVTNLYLGNLISQRLKMDGNINLILFTLLSCLILWILAKIPFIGWLISFLVCIFGIGLIFVNIFLRKKDDKDNVSEN